MKWDKRAVDSALVKEMARRYEIDLLTATIFVRRGLTAPEAVRFFLQDDPRGLHNPFLMLSMAEAVERINAAVDSGEKILIFGDRDVDGITSTVLLFEALQEMGAEVQWLLPEGEEAYGLSRGVIERAAAAGVGLLITVDCGVSNSLEIESAASFGTTRRRGSGSSSRSISSARRARSFGLITSEWTAAVTRTASAATRFRSWPGC
jgi:single-stranded-DNA-specific exonuclease